MMFMCFDVFPDKPMHRWYVAYSGKKRWLTCSLVCCADMRADVQEIFKMTPHEKQVMMFSATMGAEMRAICKKFLTNVRAGWQRHLNLALAPVRPAALHNKGQTSLSHLLRPAWCMQFQQLGVA